MRCRNNSISESQGILRRVATRCWRAIVLVWFWMCSGAASRQRRVEMLLHCMEAAMKRLATELRRSPRVGNHPGVDPGRPLFEMLIRRRTRSRVFTQLPCRRSRQRSLAQRFGLLGDLKAAVSAHGVAFGGTMRFRDMTLRFVRGVSRFSCLWLAVLAAAGQQRVDNRRRAKRSLPRRQPCSRRGHGHARRTS